MKAYLSVSTFNGPPGKSTILNICVVALQDAGYKVESCRNSPHLFRVTKDRELTSEEVKK